MVDTCGLVYSYMRMERSDEQLIADYLEGDEAALSVLVGRYTDDLYAFAVHLVGDHAAAEDIAQEAFVKAWRHMRGFLAGGNFKSWLFSIARNTALDWLRKKKSIAFSSFENEQGENALVDTLADEAPLQDELLARAHDAHYITSLLEELTPEYREVLMLKNSGNLTFAEVGAIVKRPLHTVKSQYRRAFAALERLAKANPAA